MKDLLVCCPQKALEHKKKDGKHTQGKECYWTMKRKPKDLLESKKIYFAVNGLVQGYFDIDWIGNWDSGTIIFFDSDSWHELPEPKKRIKPSQGWRYYDE